MALTTRELLIHISKHPQDYPLGEINRILSSLPPHEAATYAALGAGLDYLSEGGRDFPFQQKQTLESVDPDESNKDRNDLERVYQRAADEGIAASLLGRMGDDSSLPANDGPPTLREITEAAYEHSNK